MAGAKYGKSDPDLRNRAGRGKTKERTDRKLPAAGSEPEVSAMVGGVANKAGNPSEKKGAAKRR